MRHLTGALCQKSMITDSFGKKSLSASSTLRFEVWCRQTHRTFSWVVICSDILVNIKMITAKQSSHYWALSSTEEVQLLLVVGSFTQIKLLHSTVIGGGDTHAGVDSNNALRVYVCSMKVLVQPHIVRWQMSHKTMLPIMTSPGLYYLGCGHWT